MLISVGAFATEPPSVDLNHLLREDDSSQKPRLQVPKLAIPSHLINKGLASTGIEASPSVEQDGAGTLSCGNMCNEKAASQTGLGHALLARSGGCYLELGSQTNAASAPIACEYNHA